MTRPDNSGTLYRAQPPANPLPDQREAAPEPAVDAAAPADVAPAGATADVWSVRATTSHGMIGRPVSRAAAGAVADPQATGLATTSMATDLTRPAEIVPDPPRTGTVYGRRPTDRGAGTVLSARMPRLHIGWHSASPRACAMIAVSATGVGLVLGMDRRQSPVPIRFFRPEATRITLVGGAWITDLLVFRALALGAIGTVRTADPAAWRSVGERATGVRDRLIVNPDGYQSLRPATAQQPTLVIDDGGDPVDSTDTTEPGPWQTRLTILRQLDEHGVPEVQDSHLVLMQRLGSAEAAYAASALRLTGHSVETLQQLDDDVVGLFSSDDPRYVRISPTDIERGYAGGPRR